MSESQRIRELEEEVARLKSQLQSLKGDAGTSIPPREKITEMSSEVVDSNPYSRLMALKRMGIVANYERIRDFSVIVVGLGGIGR